MQIYTDGFHHENINKNISPANY